MKRFLLTLVLGASTVLSAQTSEGFTRGPVFAGCDTTGGSEAAISCMQQAIVRHIGQNFIIPKVERDALHARTAAWKALPRGERKNTPEPELNGRIFVTFYVEIDGSLGEVEVSKVTGELMKETQEAGVEVVKSLPPFQRPAYEDGKPVRQQFTIPISVRVM
jgi:hypothetical protein